MKERIILAPGLNGNELLRSLALHGINNIGMRVCSGAELARLALMRSGIPVSEEFVDAREETALVAEAVKGEAYFENASFSDLQKITNALRRMRGLAAGGDEEQILQETLSKGIFQEKNTALLHVYQKYMAALAARNAVDSISLIRRAAEESDVLNAEFMTLEEYPLTPLVKTLLQKVSGGVVMAGKIQDLFGTGENGIQLAGIMNCFGTPNEVEAVLDHIYSGNKSIDRCTVAVTDVFTYGQLFFDYALLYDIPVTFGSGIPVLNSNPARLLSLYYKWRTDGFYGSEAIRDLIASDAFDWSKLYGQFQTNEEKGNGFRKKAFYDLLESLRLTEDGQDNERRIDEVRHELESEAARITGKGLKKSSDIQNKLDCIPYSQRRRPAWNVP